MKLLFKSVAYQPNFWWKYKQDLFTLKTHRRNLQTGCIHIFYHKNQALFKDSQHIFSGFLRTKIFYNTDFVNTNVHKDHNRMLGLWSIGLLSLISYLYFIEKFHCWKHIEPYWFIFCLLLLGVTIWCIAIITKRITV